MKITNLNPDSDIGANSWFLEIDNHRLLLDAGTHPKKEGYQSLPMFKLIKNQEVDAIAITHCHHDHIGALPVAFRHWQRAHILLTDLSYFIAERVLHNSVNVMEHKKNELGINEYPLYTHEDIDHLYTTIQGFKYNSPVEWAAYHKARAGLWSPVLEFFDAGHALGAAGILVRGKKTTFFYTGDVCFRDQTLLKGARFQGVQADVLLIETTRGARHNPEPYNREKEVERFILSLENALNRKSCVLIPTFALGRTQEILAILALMTQQGRLKPQPIYIGGLGRVFTEIYDLQAHRTRRKLQNLQLRQSLNLQVLEREQLLNMKLSGARIFVLTAGMMNENTAAHELAIRIAGQERHAIFFVGYADPDSPAGRMKVSKKGEPFFFSQTAGHLIRNCELQDFDLTAHAERVDMLKFVGRVKPKVVLLGHGCDEARAWFEEQIKKHYPKIKVIQPKPGETVDI
ncbi:MAG: MBL fold metallo-hydrolase [Verrucomicrobiae bacterium]|nr:MBL fold metallo-hydrolase [Verrucomicrobiae bacterium]